MPEYRSKERVERDGVLVYAEGDEIPASDVAELERQGYDVPEAPTVHRSKEAVVRDGVLVYAEGDVIPGDDVDELERQGLIDKSAKKATGGANKKQPAGPDKST